MIDLDELEELHNRWQELSSELPDDYLNFVLNYVDDPNGTQAALDAGFGNGNRRSAQVQASRMLSNVMVRDAIDVFMKIHSMSKSEALHLQAAIARGHVFHFLDVNHDIDMGLESAKRNKHIIKKYSCHSWSDDKGNLHTERTIEMYPADKAQHTILRTHGAFVDNKNINITRDPINEMTDDQLNDEIARLEEIVGEEE